MHAQPSYILHSRLHHLSDVLCCAPTSRLRQSQRRSKWHAQEITWKHKLYKHFWKSWIETFHLPLQHDFHVYIVDGFLSNLFRRKKFFIHVEFLHGQDFEKNRLTCLTLWLLLYEWTIEMCTNEHLQISKKAIFFGLNPRYMRWSMLKNEPGAQGNV